MEFSQSSACCNVQALGMGPGDTVLGSVGANLVSVGMRGFSWNVGEEPTDLTGDAFTIAAPEFMNEAGWIAGEASICPKSDGACDRHIFFISPQGELIDVGEQVEGAVWVVGLTEENHMVYQAWSSPYVIDPYGMVEELPTPPGGQSPLALGVTPDGSVIGGTVWIDGAKFPVRWIDGEAEVLSIPDALGDVTYVAVDGSILGDVWESEKAAYHAVRWNPDGEVAYLPEPAGTTTSGAGYGDEEIVIGSAMIDGVYHVVIWTLDNDEVTDFMTVEISPDVAGGFAALSRAGDIVAIPLFNVHNYVPALLLVSVDGSGASWCEDAVVIGEFELDPSNGLAPSSAFTNVGSDSILVHVGFQQSDAYLLERLRPGDVNGDSIVNGIDISLILGFWGGSDRAADLNGDGIVSGADLTIALGDWG